MRARPTIKSPCVADRYHGPQERIAEVFSAEAQTGCLIRALVRYDDDGRPYLDVSLYRIGQSDACARVTFTETEVRSAEARR